MPYTVAGTLKLPETGKPAAGVILKFIALTSISPVLGRSESIVVTSATGAYSLSLEYNAYSVFATLYDNKPIQCGEIILNSQTQTGLDLPTLLNGGQYEPPTPAWILQIQAWIIQASQSATNSATSASQSASSAQQASAFAKNASDSALLAQQITGLGTVADAIAVAAVPLPDVWLPLNDSLRLLTGYGREVKVGSDVVAVYAACDRASVGTYINKLGKVVSAAINEPRNEKEGLLVEGQSTNLVLNSLLTTNASFSRTTRDNQTSTDPMGTSTATLVANTVDTGVHWFAPFFVSAPATKAVAGSIFLKADTVTFATIRIMNNTGDTSNGVLSIGVNLLTGEAITSASAGASLLSYKVEMLSDGWVRVSLGGLLTGTEARLFTYLAKALELAPPSYTGNTSERLYVWGAQLEVAPAASSFILTTNAAATRAADFPSLQREGNDNYFGKMTLAVEVHCNGRGVEGAGTDAHRGIFTAYPHSNSYEMLYISSALSRPMWAYGSQGSAGGAVPYQVEDGNIHTLVVQCDGAKNRLYLDGFKGGSEFDATNPGVGPVTGTKLFLGYGAGSTNARHLWGHIRNLRMWINKNITDAQCRSIK